MLQGVFDPLADDLVLSVNPAQLMPGRLRILRKLFEYFVAHLVQTEERMIVELLIVEHPADHVRLEGDLLPFELVERMQELFECVVLGRVYVWLKQKLEVEIGGI